MRTGGALISRCYRRDVDRRFLRPGWLVGHLLVVLAVLACLRLGWWQWERTREATGTAQNLGYALLWPCFGAAFIYMWVRFLQLERIRDRDDAQAMDDDLAEMLAGAAADAAPDGVPNPPAGSVAEAADPAEPTAAAAPREQRSAPPSRAVPLSVAIVGDDDEDDPELAAYNRALADLAEKDRRRAP